MKSKPIAKNQHSSREWSDDAQCSDKKTEWTQTHMTATRSSTWSWSILWRTVQFETRWTLHLDSVGVLRLKSTTFRPFLSVYSTYFPISFVFKLFIFITSHFQVLAHPSLFLNWVHPCASTVSSTLGSNVTLVPKRPRRPVHGYEDPWEEVTSMESWTPYFKKKSIIFFKRHGSSLMSIHSIIYYP